MRKTPANFNGFTYMEVLVALLVFSIALVPAMESIQASLRAVRQDVRSDAGVERNVTDGQAVINKMEALLAMPTADIETNIPANRTIPHAMLSDPADVVPRCLVYTAWFKPEAEMEMNRYVDTKTSLLWVKVAVEGSGVSATTLVLIP